MIQKAILVLALLFVQIGLRAQHCGWDGVGVIMLDVRDAHTSKAIEGLNIVLADSNGVPLTSEWNLLNFKGSSLFLNTDTLKFAQFDKKKLAENESYHVPFPNKIYLLFVYANNYPSRYENQKDKIIISDPGGLYDTVELTLGLTPIADMCTSGSIHRSKEGLQKAIINLRLSKKHN